MVRKIFLVIVFAGFAVGMHSQKGYQCRWQNGSAGIEIPDEWYTTVKKGGIRYCFTNDNTCLFLNMRVSESAGQSRILRTGMTLWIDTEGKSRKKTGVRFPVGSDYQGPGRRPGAAQQTTPLSMANSIQLIGFNQNGQSRVPAANPDGVRGKVFYDDNGDLICTIVIPRNSFTGSGTLGETPFSLGIEIGAPPPAPEGGQGFSPGGPGGGMERPAGGRPPGGGGGRGMAPPGGGMPSGGMAQPTQTATLIWVKNASLASGN